MQNLKRVDLSSKKTEAEWQTAIDRFWLDTTPEIFKWLGWVAALAALKVIEQKSGSKIVSAMNGLCYVAMIFYFNAFFFQYEFINTPFVKNSKLRRFVSLVISGALAGLAGWLASKAMLVFSNTTS
jgi:hypothetical protein